MSLRFHEIAETNGRIQNPFSEEKLALLGAIVHDLGQNRPGCRQIITALTAPPTINRYNPRIQVSFFAPTSAYRYESQVEALQWRVRLPHPRRDV